MRSAFSRIRRAPAPLSRAPPHQSTSQSKGLPQLRYVVTTSCRSGSFATPGTPKPCGGGSDEKRQHNLVLERTDLWVQHWVVRQRLCPFAKPLLRQQSLRIAVSSAETIEELQHDLAEEMQRLELVSVEYTYLGEILFKYFRRLCKSLGISGKESCPSGSAHAGGRSGLDVSSSSADVSSSSSSPMPLPPPESTLLVVPGGPTSFEDFYHIRGELQRTVVHNGGEGMLQLVLFHPEARHSLYAEQSERSDEASDHSDVSMSTISDPRDLSIRAPYPTVHLLREIDVMAARRGNLQPELIPERNAAKLRALGEAEARIQWQKSFSDGNEPVQ